MRSELKVIELFFIIAIIAVVVTTAVGLLNRGDAVHAEVIEKWTDMDEEGNTVYRVRVRQPNGEVLTLNSWWVHGEIHIGHWYTVYYRTFGVIKKVTPGIPPPAVADPR